jgi:toluene monooxygenase electron transfer component
MVGEVMTRTVGGRYDNTVAFVAGPPVMVDSVLRHLLYEAKMPRAFVRYDKFA